MIPSRLRVKRGGFRPRGVEWMSVDAGSTNRLWRGSGGNGPWLLKWYRYPQPGVHPEPEMARFLEMRGFEGIAAFGARIDQRRETDWVTAGYVQRWVEGVSCWDMVLEGVRSSGDVSAWAGTMGAVIGRMHRALSGPEIEEEAFAPRSYGRAQHLAWVRRVRAVALQLEAALRGAPPAGAEAGAWESARVLWVEKGAVWRERLEALESIEVAGSCCRVHGDLHLGQILRVPLSGGGWRHVVVDFEGEPLRALEERRVRDTPLRDVAGMWRSFAYAAGAAGAGKEVARRMQEAFWEGWCRSMSPPEGDWSALLSGLVWEKAIYEALYEIRHRPGWLGIPLAALWEAFF